jgi:glycyl-tRNA synthetase
MNDLKLDYTCFYEEKDAIGKRYRRQDALGTPFCITIDHESLENQTVTIRYRDTMKQERISIEKIREILSEEISWKKLLA